MHDRCNIPRIGKDSGPKGELFTLSHIVLEESLGIPVVLLGLQGFLEEFRRDDNPANVL